jgi:hypothetical protein
MSFYLLSRKLTPVYKGNLSPKKKASVYEDANIHLQSRLSMLGLKCFSGKV